MANVNVIIYSRQVLLPPCVVVLLNLTAIGRLIATGVGMHGERRSSILYVIYVYIYRAGAAIATQRPKKVKQLCV